MFMFTYMYLTDGFNSQIPSFPTCLALRKASSLTSVRKLFKCLTNSGLHAARS